MKKDKVSATLYYIAAILFYISAIINFAGENSNYSMAVVWICLGSTFLCLGSSYSKKSTPIDTIGSDSFPTGCLLPRTPRVPVGAPKSFGKLPRVSEVI